MLVLFLLSSCSINKDIYWEEIGEKDRKKILCSSEISYEAKMVYQDKFILSDNEMSEVLLNELTSKIKNKKITAFYFFLLNRICASSDGAFAEMCDEYLYNYMESNINYVLHYVKKNKNMLSLYADCISAGLDWRGLELIDYEKVISPKVSKTNRKTYKLLINEVRVPCSQSVRHFVSRRRYN